MTDDAQTEEMPEPNQAGAMPVATFVADEVAGIEPGASLLDIADALVTADVGALAVRDGEQVVGIVSERDLVHALAHRRDPIATTAMDIASTELTWCDVEATVAEVAAEMATHYVRHVLVEDGGQLVGIVSARDLLGVYASADLDIE